MSTVIEALRDLAKAAGSKGRISVNVSDEHGNKHSVSIQGGYAAVTTEPLFSRALMVLHKEFTDKQKDSRSEYGF